jgi:predicted nucleic acid-binding protein
MAANALVDTSFLVAFLNRRDANHVWATSLARRTPLPWRTCEPVLSEAFHVLGSRGSPSLIKLLTSRAVICSFQLTENIDDVLRLLRKYVDVPMSLADACLVRMSETLTDPVLLTSDTDFRIYRRHGRQTVPCILPR